MPVNTYMALDDDDDDNYNNWIQFNFLYNSIYLCAKLISPEANYKVSTGKKMGRVRSKKISENNNIVVKVIKE
jgi:hypothetical protein